MPSIPDGKRGVYIYLDEEVYSLLLNFIKTVEIRTNALKSVDPSLPRSHKTAQRIIDLLRERGYYKQVSIEEIYRAIEDIRGSDQRTKKKWLKFMVDHGYLKWRTHRILEISPALLEAENFFSKL